MTTDSEIEEGVDEIMTDIGRLLQLALNSSPATKNWGFFFAVFPFGDDPGRFNYISNADRRDIITLLKEMLARFEGQPEMKGHA